MFQIPRPPTGGRLGVPIISTFFGIVIRMFYKEPSRLTFTPSTAASTQSLDLMVNCSQARFVPGKLVTGFANGRSDIEPNWRLTGTE